jgi:hypothetical protein
MPVIVSKMILELMGNACGWAQVGFQNGNTGAVDWLKISKQMYFLNKDHAL